MIFRKKFGDEISLFILHILEPVVFFHIEPYSIYSSFLLRKNPYKQEVRGETIYLFSFDTTRIAYERQK